MKASVIIPVFNHADKIGEAIQSALDQTRPPHEIIVVDDGSTDGSYQAAEKFGDRVKVIRQDNSGPATARNRAAREATGDWLALLDADDLWLPEKLETLSKFIKAVPGAALIHSNGWVVNGDEVPDGLGQADSWFAKKQPPHGKEAYKIFLGSPLLTSSVMVRRDVFEREGGFDESFRINEDADLFLRVMARGGEVLYAPKPLMVQRCSADGAGRDQLAYLENSVRMLEKALGMFPELNETIVPFLAYTTRGAGWYGMREGKPEFARRYWFRSFRYQRPGGKDLLTALLLLAGKPGLNAAGKMWRDVIERLN